MATHASDASTLIERGVEEQLFVFDRRINQEGFERNFPFSDLKGYKEFLHKVNEVFLRLNQGFIFSILRIRGSEPKMVGVFTGKNVAVKDLLPRKTTLELMTTESNTYNFKTILCMYEYVSN